MSVPDVAPRPVTPLGILARSLEQLSRSLDDVVGLDPQLLAQAREARDLAAGLDPYLEECTTAPSPALAALAERTARTPWAGTLEQEMLSGHVEGQVLKMLVHATRAVRVLEIGMFTGYSALAMAEALPPGGEVTACEIDADVAAFARECFAASPAGARIRVEVGPALQTLARLRAEGATYDLVFVDADKPGYAAYLDAVLDGLLAPHGLVAVDNTLLQGHPWLRDEPGSNGDAIADFNRAVAADPRVEQVLLPLRDGLTLIRRAPDADPRSSS